MDIVWLADGGLLVAGPATRPIEALATSTGSSVGVRFRPGVAPSVLRAPASTFRDAHLTLDAVWPREARLLGDEADGASEPSIKLGLLLQLVAGHLRKAQPDALVQDAIAILSRDSSTTVEALAGALAVSQRHLLRSFTSHVGYGPKTLQRILRFRRSLNMLRTTPFAGLTDVALSAGYADHAHMTREFVQLGSLSPQDVRYMTARSDSFKRRSACPPSLEAEPCQFR